MNNPFDTSNVGLRERPNSGDINRAQSQMYRTMRYLAQQLLGGRASNSSAALGLRTGFVGDGLRVVGSNPAAMSVQVSAGLGFIYSPLDVPTDIGATDLEDVDDLSPFKPVFLMSPHTFPVVAPGANSRIDIIEVKVDRRLEDSIVRRQLEVSTKQFLDHSFYKTLAYALDGRTGTVAAAAQSTAGLSYKTGVESASPVAPATSTGYVKIGEVRTTSATTSIDGRNIVDTRKLHAPYGVVQATLRFTLNWNGGAPVSTILDCMAPPGVEMAVIPSTSNKSMVELVVIGGDIQHASVCPSLEMPNGIVAQSAMMHRHKLAGIASGVGLGVAPFLSTVSAAESTAFNLATPSLKVGIGQKRIYTFFDAVVFNSTGDISVSGGDLDNLAYTANVQLAYH